MQRDDAISSVERATRALLDAGRGAWPLPPDLGSAADAHCAGVSFPTDVLGALGLGDLKGVVDFSIRWNGVHGELTVTRMITREQGVALAAVLKRARYLISEPQDLGQARTTVPDARADADFRPTPTFRRPAE